MKKPLPIGISSFRELIKSGCLYIDKTHIVHELITSTSRRYFFSRPRRFGKSLLLSLFKEVFSGSSDLFSDTWLGQHSSYTWPVYPVIDLDLSRLDSSSVERLEAGLCQQLDAVAVRYGIDLSTKTFPVAKMTDLVVQLAQQEKVVFLVDEYDSPILKTMGSDRELSHRNREVLNQFFTAIKSVNEYMRFVFFTGVSKFAKTSVFSGLNHLSDVSLEPKVAALCGYTDEEVRNFLSSYLDEFAFVHAISAEAALLEMRTWYNGYRFSRDAVTVYNPYSIFFALERKLRENYWFETGTTKFLVDSITDKFEQFMRLESLEVKAGSLGAFEIEEVPLVNLLFQTGYLTIEKYSYETQRYALKYPNQEVKQAFDECLMSGFLRLERAAVDAYQLRLQRAITVRDIEGFCCILQELFSQIPYDLHIKKEAYYHTFLHIIGTLLGLDVQSEVHTSLGRIDLTLQTRDTIYLFELKLNKDPLEALNQIKTKRYYEKYEQLGKVIYLIGLAFTFETKMLEHAWEQL